MSFANLLLTFTKYSRKSKVDISSKRMSGLPFSSKGTRLANSRSSSSTSPLAIILLVPLRIHQDQFAINIFYTGARHIIGRNFVVEPYNILKNIINLLFWNPLNRANGNACIFLMD